MLDEYHLACHFQYIPSFQEKETIEELILLTQASVRIHLYDYFIFLLLIHFNDTVSKLTSPQLKRISNN